MTDIIDATENSAADNAASDGGPSVTATDTPAAESSTSPSDNPSENSETPDSGRFKEGQMLTFVRVRFPGQAKALPFFIGNSILK